MLETERRLRHIRLLALVLVGLSLLVVLVSAQIRLTGAGLGCSPWPECYGQVLIGETHSQGGAVRILHRSVASLALVLGFILVWMCQRPVPVEAPKRPATALLSLMILLTLVGIFSADPHRVWAGFFNILGGAVLVLLSWRTVLAARTPVAPPAMRRSAPLLHVGLALLALTLALGALIGARYAAPACPSLPGCGDILWPVSGWNAMNPLVTIEGPARLGDPGGEMLHLLHRWFALATLVTLGLGGLQAMRLPSARMVAGVVLLLLFVQFALGVVTVASGFGLGLAVAHGVCATLLLALGMHLLLILKGRAD